MNKILIVNFSVSQYTHLISNSIRKLNICSEIIHGHNLILFVLKMCGIILSKVPKSVSEPNFPNIYTNKIPLDIPILKILLRSSINS